MADQPSATDRLIASVAALLMLLCFVMPLFARPFVTMYGDFGGPVPGVTKAAAKWLGPAVGITIAMFFYAARNTEELGMKRLYWIGAFFLGLFGFGGGLVALYWPIFSIAGHISD